MNLDSGRFCRREITSRSRFAKLAVRKCHRLANHDGACNEMPFLDDLWSTHPRVADKISRDATMTTGAAWKSSEAGPNRILRWVMLLPDKELREFGIDMTLLKPQVVRKLREKAATYDACIEVAMWLAWSAYQMPGAPKPPKDTRVYLEDSFGPMKSDSTECAICLLPLPFKLFESAQRGRAPIETCHKDPRYHTPENVGFAHRECNIAQGPKTLGEFYDWIEGIIQRVRSRFGKS